MALFRRERTAAPAADPTLVETPAALRARLEDVVARTHFAAGRLPVASVVAALAVTDALAEVIDTADDGVGQDGLDINALVSLQGILDDYLPTTLRAYLALDPATTTLARPSGQTPQTSLLEQLEALWLAASDLLTAVRARDADALMSQGAFLRTKFAGSDLDL